MGSFTSMPKVIPAANVDDESEAGVYPAPGQREPLQRFLERCRAHLDSLPPPIDRSLKNIDHDHNKDNAKFDGGEKVRVLQWNVLSQGRNYNLIKHLSHFREEKSCNARRRRQLCLMRQLFLI